MAVAENLPHTWGLKEEVLEVGKLIIYLPHTWGLKVNASIAAGAGVNLPHTWGLKGK